MPWVLLYVAALKSSVVTGTSCTATHIDGRDCKGPAGQAFRKVRNSLDGLKERGEGEGYEGWSMEPILFSFLFFRLIC
uniref:Putative secreted protein n=1 Tax=Anopheles darlingi TaxID=43151 RepID=A0A2M4DAK7_ANODA